MEVISTGLMAKTHLFAQVNKHLSGKRLLALTDLLLPLVLLLRCVSVCVDPAEEDEQEGERREEKKNRCEKQVSINPLAPQ